MPINGGEAASGVAHLTLGVADLTRNERGYVSWFCCEHRVKSLDSAYPHISVHSNCVGCVIEPRNRHVAGAETVEIVECNMSGAATRGAVALLGSKSTSRAEGMHWKLGDPASDHWRGYALVRIGKVRSRSR